MSVPKDQGEHTFDSLIVVFLKNKPSEPNVGCPLRRFYILRIREWKDLRLLSIVAGLLFVLVIGIAFTPYTSEPHISLITSFLALLAAVVVGCGHYWYKIESTFRFVVERCLTYTLRMAEGENTDNFIKEAEDRLENGRI